MPATKPGPFAGRKHTAATKAKLRAAYEARGCPAPTFAGRKHTPEALEKIGAAHRGKVVSEATRAKLAAAHRGKVVSEATRAKLRRPMSEATKAKLRAKALLRGPRSAEHRAKLAASIKRSYTPELRELRRRQLLGVKKSKTTRARIGAAQKARHIRDKLGQLPDLQALFAADDEPRFKGLKQIDGEWVMVRAE